MDSTTSSSYTSGWYSFTNYLTIGPAWGCALNPNIVTGSDGTFSYPAAGPVPWRSSSSVSQTSGCGGGSLSVGGLGVDGNGGGCGNSTSPYISFGCSTPGSSWTVGGKWEFSNDQSTIEATWSGRE